MADAIFLRQGRRQCHHRSHQVFRPSIHLLLFLLLLPLGLVTVAWAESTVSDLPSLSSNNIESSEEKDIPEQKSTLDWDEGVQGSNSSSYNFESSSSSSINSSLDVNGTKTSTSRHQGFVHGFVESLSVILVSELGDKTFFIAAIMAMTSNKLTVFLAAISALALMTVLSALLGLVVTSLIPRKYTYYACTVIMFLFGLKMLWEAWKMKPEEAEELQQEVQDEIQQRRRGSSGAGSHEMEECQQERSGDGDKEEESGNNARGEEEEEGLAAAATGAPLDPEARRESELRRSSRIRFREKSVFGKKCYKILKLFVNCFTMTFLAEWGDRSQLATIVLASVNDVAGVCIGGVLGHSICTGLAVIAGAIIAKKISPRIVTFVGAVVFLLYAVASLFYDPESQEMIKIDI